MFFSKAARPPDIHSGTLFQRKLGNTITELAEVVWVGKDAAGIPHVRFNVSYVRAQDKEPQGSRMLAVATFAERYAPISPPRPWQAERR